MLVWVGWVIKVWFISNRRWKTKAWTSHVSPGLIKPGLNPIPKTQKWLKLQHSLPNGMLIHCRVCFPIYCWKSFKVERTAATGKKKCRSQENNAPPGLRTETTTKCPVQILNSRPQSWWCMREKFGVRGMTCSVQERRLSWVCSGHADW